MWFHDLTSAEHKQRSSGENCRRRLLHKHISDTKAKIPGKALSMVVVKPNSQNIGRSFKTEIKICFIDAVISYLLMETSHFKSDKISNWRINWFVHKFKIYLIEKESGRRTTKGKSKEFCFFICITFQLPFYPRLTFLGYFSELCFTQREIQINVIVNLFKSNKCILACL